jgi:hypothetical protein
MPQQSLEGWTLEAKGRRSFFPDLSSRQRGALDRKAHLGGENSWLMLRN